MKRPDLGVLSFLILLAFLQALYYYPKLPESVAAHFNASGDPDGWSNKQSFFVCNLVLVLLIALLFLGIGLLLRKMPTSLINIPNKEYWLAPERRDETFNILSIQFNWLACATVIFMLLLFQLIIHANLSSEHSLGIMPWVIVVLYLGFTGLWIIRLLRRFRRNVGQ